MNRKIMIVTHPKDFHAHVVEHALRIKGADPILWQTSDFPTRATEAVQFEPGSESIEIRDLDAQLLPADIGSLWLRRPRMELGPAQLHPADRSFAFAQCRRFRESFLEILSLRVQDRGGLCVSPFRAIQLGESKLWQHHLASQIGLEMPATLYGNDPASIRRFLDTHGGRIVFKPFTGETWFNGTTHYGCYTSAISEEDLVDDDLLQAAPGIYQELVPKAFELRITMIGDRAFSGKINSQETKNGKLDWRRSYEDVSMEPYELPEELLRKCRELMRRLGLLFGCFDFIVTPDGRSVFLEVNPAGQFLFVETYAGLPVVDALCELLIQGRPDFEWKESHSTLRLADFWDEVSETFKPEDSRHVDTNYPVTRETPAAETIPSSL